GVRTRRRGPLGEPWVPPRRRRRGLAGEPCGSPAQKWGSGTRAGCAEEGGCYPPTTTVNRFFRSALFPLIVIVLLVYLASQTLMNNGKKSEKVTTSEVYQDINAGKVTDAVFSPTKNELTATLTDGTKVKVNYASDQAQIQLQNLLEKRGVNWDSKGTGSSPWWGLLTGLLPFVLLFGFWIFLMNQVQGGGSKVMSFGKSRAKRMT